MRLFPIYAALFVEHGVSMEAGGNTLFVRPFRKHVAGKLLDGEPIERHVTIQRIDDPVAIFPNGAAAVGFEAVGVGVTRQIEPRTLPALPIERPCKQAVSPL